MYLYDKKKDKLDIYRLNPQEEKLYQYRIEQMKKIPQDETIFKAITNAGFSSYEIFDIYKEKFDIEIIPIQNVNGDYHKLEPDLFVNMNKSKEILLDCYYYGDLKDKKIARIQDLKKIRYFLLNQTKYISNNVIKELKGIIEIPESLYLLSLIEQEKFSLIGNKDILEQLNLFKVEQLKELDLETIQRMNNMGIFTVSYSDIIKKAENDSHVLKLLKK